MESYSGQLRLRLGPALHAHVAALAAREGISINALLVAVIAGGTGFRFPDATGAAGPQDDDPRERSRSDSR